MRGGRRFGMAAMAVALVLMSACSRDQDMATTEEAPAMGSAQGYGGEMYAQDVGAFPDSNIAESVQRVPTDAPPPASPPPPPPPPGQPTLPGNPGSPVLFLAYTYQMGLE